MNAHRSLIPITLALLLSGCTSFGFLSGPSVDPIEIRTTAVERTRLNLPDPDPISARPVEFIVITPENAEETWAKLRESNTDLVLFGLTDEGYESLALNIADIRNVLNEYRVILIKYKDYYEPVETPPSQ
mgnify:CR=1 FL=1